MGGAGGADGNDDCGGGGQEEEGLSSSSASLEVVSGGSGEFRQLPEPPLLCSSRQNEPSRLCLKPRSRFGLFALCGELRYN